MGRAEDLAAGAGGTTKFLKGKQVDGQDVYGYLDAPKAWGGFGFYFLGSRASAYAKHPDDKAWLFDPDTMKPRINNPAWVRAIQDVIDALPSEPPDQINADPQPDGFQQFLAGTGSMVVWWGDVGSNVKTNDASVVGDVTGFSILPGSDDVYNSKTGQWDKLASGPNYAPNCAYIGWGVYVMARVDTDEKKKKAAWSAAAHLGGKDLSLWCAAYPSGFQPYRNSHFNIPEWVAAGYDEAFISSYLKSEADSYNHPNAAIEPRIPGIFQYYSVAEDELAKIFAGQANRPRGRRRHRGGLGEDHRPDRPRKPDQALQGLTGHVSRRYRNTRLAADTGAGLFRSGSWR